MKHGLPSSLKNWISLAGATIALISLFMIVFLFAVTLTLEKQAAYLGLVVYILLPGVMLTGLMFIPVGMFYKIRRDHREGVRPKQDWPRIDLNDPRQRNAALIFAVGTTLFLFLSAFGSYQAFEYTESVSFCGTLCHTVMEPEHVAHSNSAHARVRCVECHVGPGVDWYVRSKLSGLYQVYAVSTNKFPRPIPTPIENLRPARAVCEQCHWPQKFYAHQYLVRTHYLPDRENTRWEIGLTLKIGPPQQSRSYHSGIHWHINPQVKIEYRSSNEKREELPWVRYTNLETGQVKVFQDAENALQPAQIGSIAPRTMDCLDCHNRPSHRYLSPSAFIDLAMASGEIPSDLPELKREAVQLCSSSYATSEAATEAIGSGLKSLYRDKFPEIWNKRRQEVEQAVDAVQANYVRNAFPEMKANWNAYPDHIGHLESNGCFRCHNGRHRTSEGEIISNACDLCHTIVSQGTPDALEQATLGGSLPFRHPVDIGGMWSETPCADCHRQ